MKKIKTILALFSILTCHWLITPVHSSELKQHQVEHNQAKRQHQVQQQAHYNQKYQQQHFNYKNQIENQRRQQQKTSTYRQPVYQHKKRPVYHYKKQPVYHNKKTYHYKKKYKYIKWPRIRGRCKYSPWTVDGVNPVLDEADKGNMVLLFMLKVGDPFSYNQLGRLNDLAEHYLDIGRKITVMALAHRRRTIPASYRERFPLVQFHQEPKSKNIYNQIRAKYRFNIIYDKCGRQQYHFGPPYSWLGYDITRLAIENVRRFHTDYNLCGKCRARPLTTVGPTNALNSTATAPPSTKPPTKATESAVDGPYTNIPVAVKKA
ncbi:selenoprotein P-like [Clytia hemisphaerica]